jgi:hypothetical protein
VSQRETESFRVDWFDSKKLVDVDTQALLEDSGLFVEKRIVLPSDPVSYAGGSACQKGQGLNVRRNAVPGHPIWETGHGANDPTLKKLLLRNHGEVKTDTWL